MLTSVSIPNLQAAAKTTNDTPVYLQFGVGSRALLLGSPDPGVTNVHGLPTVLRTDLATVSQSQVTPITVESIGERPALASVVLDAGAGATTILWADPIAPAAAVATQPIGDVCGGHPASSTVPGAPADYLYGPKEYIAAMERLLERAGPGQRQRRFFFEIDRATHPLLVGGKFVESPRQSLVQISFERRVSLFNRGKGATLPPPEEVTYDDPPATKYLDALFRIFESLLVDLDEAEIDDAMDHFAGGALRMRLPNGEWTTQPSSGYFFFFGEVGLLGVAFRDPELWTPFARAAIRAQEIFTEVYRVKGPVASPYDLYDACAYRESARVTMTRQRRLRAQYGSMPIEALQRAAAQNALRWLPGVV